MILYAAQSLGLGPNGRENLPLFPEGRPKIAQGETLGISSTGPQSSRRADRDSTEILRICTSRFWNLGC